MKALEENVRRKDIGPWNPINVWLGHERGKHIDMNNTLSLVAVLLQLPITKLFCDVK